MNIKGLIVSSGKEYKTFDCNVSVPALKVHIENKDMSELVNIMPLADYTNVIFMVNGNPVDVELFLKDNNALYVSAREVAKLDLNNMEILKENTLVQKYINNALNTTIKKPTKKFN